MDCDLDFWPSKLTRYTIWSSFSRTKHWRAFWSSAKTVSPSSGERLEASTAAPSWVGANRCSDTPSTKVKGQDLVNIVTQALFVWHKCPKDRRADIFCWKTVFLWRTGSIHKVFLCMDANFSSFIAHSHIAKFCIFTCKNLFQWNYWHTFESTYKNY